MKKQKCLTCEEVNTKFAKHPCAACLNHQSVILPYYKAAKFPPCCDCAHFNVELNIEPCNSCEKIEVYNHG